MVTIIKNAIFKSLLWNISYCTKSVAWLFAAVQWCFYLAINKNGSVTILAVFQDLTTFKKLSNLQNVENQRFKKNIFIVKLICH